MLLAGNIPAEKSVAPQAAGPMVSSGLNLAENSGAFGAGPVAASAHRPPWLSPTPPAFCLKWLTTDFTCQQEDMLFSGK